MLDRDNPNFKNKTALNVISEILYYLQEPANGIHAANLILTSSIEDAPLEEQLKIMLLNQSLQKSKKILRLIDEIIDWKDNQTRINQ
ncbi:MAG: hypothetical protein ACI97N_001512 [Cognaticolwellia sp.]|jgi:hypothetical protein